MREYQQKHLLRTLVYSRVTMIILFLLVVLLLRSIVELNDKRIDVARLRSESAIEKKELEAKVEKAQEKNERIQTDSGMEAYIRNTYPVVGEGEGVIVVYDDQGSPVIPVREGMTIWERLTLWLHAFKK